MDQNSTSPPVGCCRSLRSSRCSVTPFELLTADWRSTLRERPGRPSKESQSRSDLGRDAIGCPRLRPDPPTVSAPTGLLRNRSPAPSHLIQRRSLPPLPSPPQTT